MSDSQPACPAMLRSRISGESRISRPMATSRIFSGDSVLGMPKPSPRSVADTASISRSGISLRKSETMKPTTATGTAHRNTVPSESA